MSFASFSPGRSKFSPGDCKALRSPGRIYESSSGFLRLPLPLRRAASRSRKGMPIPARFLSRIKVGSRLVHKTFGPGTVHEISGDILTVDFDRAGRKKLSISVSLQAGLLSRIPIESISGFDPPFSISFKVDSIPVSHYNATEIKKHLRSYGQMSFLPHRRKS